jgi:hypothetical protein
MTKHTIDERNLVDALLRALPELETAYQDTVKGWKLDTGPGIYTLIGSTLVPRLGKELEKGQLSDFLRRCARFLESVCATGSEEAINVIWIRVFERLIYKKRELQLLWPILGPETKRTIRDAARRRSDAARMFGKENDLPEANIPE